MKVSLTHIGQYWSSKHREVRLLGACNVSLDGEGKLSGSAWDISTVLPVARTRRRYRELFRGETWESHRFTYERLPFPATELADWLESRGRSPVAWARDGVDVAGADELDLSVLERAPTPDLCHLVAPITPRRALAFGVTYLNSALERETEGRRQDYAYVYKSVKDRRERPELFIKGTSPEHFVGPHGLMGLRRDLTNSVSFEGESSSRVVVSSGIEPELAAIVSSRGEIWGYTIANDVSGNRIENETLLYLTQAKYFTGAVVLGPLVWLSDEQSNPNLEIQTRIFSAKGETIFERMSNSSRINAPLSELISWASSHVRLTPGEVISTGTDVVPDGVVKVLEPEMTVEIRIPQIGSLKHGAAFVPEHGELNIDYSRLEFANART